MQYRKAVVNRIIVYLNISSKTDKYYETDHSRLQENKSKHFILRFLRKVTLRK